MFWFSRVRVGGRSGAGGGAGAQATQEGRAGPRKTPVFAEKNSALLPFLRSCAGSSSLSWVSVSLSDSVSPVGVRLDYAFDLAGVGSQYQCRQHRLRHRSGGCSCRAKRRRRQWGGFFVFFFFLLFFLRLELGLRCDVVGVGVDRFGAGPKLYGIPISETVHRDLRFEPRSRSRCSAETGCFGAFLPRGRIGLLDPDAASKPPRKTDSAKSNHPGVVCGSRRRSNSFMGEPRHGETCCNAWRSFRECARRSGAPRLREAAPSQSR